MVKVFISSVIRGFEAQRAAAGDAARNLGHEVLRSEDFGAGATSPRRSCLEAVRAADAVVLILGARYGEPQPGSGLSPTHEEYLEARAADKVLAFVRTGVEYEPAQKTLIKEVKDWESGHRTAWFATPEELGAVVTKGLHRFEIERLAGDVDDGEIVERAAAGFAATTGYTVTLSVVVAGGPRTPIVRPSELASGAFADSLAQMAVTGPLRLFPIEGSGASIRTAGRVTFEHSLGSVGLDEFGTVFLRLPAHTSTYMPGHGAGHAVHEHVEQQTETGLRFVAGLLDRVDPAGRLSTVVPMARVSGAMAWLTATEAAEWGRTGRMTLNASREASPVHLQPPSRRRAALSADAAGLARDLTTLMRGAAVTGRGPI